MTQITSAYHLCPAIQKDAKDDVNAAEIQNAIAAFRKQFPDDKQLKATSDAAIEEKVSAFLKSKTVFPSGEITTPSVTLMATAEGSSCNMAIATVVVDCIFMLLGFVGLHASASAERAAVRGVATTVARNAGHWTSLIQNLSTATSAYEKAKAIFKIGGAAYSAGMFRGIIAEIKSSMSWWDWTITGVACIAQLALLVLTDGAAFIAEVALNATAIAYVVSDSLKVGPACSAAA